MNFLCKHEEESSEGVLIKFLVLKLVQLVVQSCAKWYEFCSMTMVTLNVSVYESQCTCSVSCFLLSSNKIMSIWPGIHFLCSSQFALWARLAHNFIIVSVISKSSRNRMQNALWEHISRVTGGFQKNIAPSCLVLCTDRQCCYVTCSSQEKAVLGEEHRHGTAFTQCWGRAAAPGFESCPLATSASTEYQPCRPKCGAFVDLNKVWIYFFIHIMPSDPHLCPIPK